MGDHRKQAGSKKGVDLRLAAIERRAAEEKRNRPRNLEVKPILAPKRIGVEAVGGHKSVAKGKEQADFFGRREVIIIDDSSDEESDDEDAKSLQQAIRASLADGGSKAGSVADDSEDEEDEEATAKEKSKMWGEIKFEKDEADYLKAGSWERQLKRCGVDDGEGDEGGFTYDGFLSKEKSSPSPSFRNPLIETPAVNKRPTLAKKQRNIDDV